MNKISGAALKAAALHLDLGGISTQTVKLPLERISFGCPLADQKAADLLGPVSDNEGWSGVVFNGRTGVGFADANLSEL